MTRLLDVTKTDIRCCDELELKDNYISVLWESTLSVEQYFGLFLKANEWIEFETRYYPDGNIKAYYSILAETPDDPEAFLDQKEWELTSKEEQFFREKMEEYCFQENKASIQELFSIGPMVHQNALS